MTNDGDTGGFRVPYPVDPTHITSYPGMVDELRQRFSFPLDPTLINRKWDETACWCSCHKGDTDPPDEGDDQE